MAGRVPQEAAVEAAAPSPRGKPPAIVIQRPVVPPSLLEVLSTPATARPGTADRTARRPSTAGRPASRDSSISSVSASECGVTEGIGAVRTGGFQVLESSSFGGVRAILDRRRRATVKEPVNSDMLNADDGSAAANGAGKSPC